MCLTVINDLIIPNLLANIQSATDLGFVEITVNFSGLDTTVWLTIVRSRQMKKLFNMNFYSLCGLQ